METIRRGTWGSSILGTIIFGGFDEYRGREILTCTDNLNANGELTTHEQRLVKKQNTLNRTEGFFRTNELTDAVVHQGVVSDKTNLYSTGSRSPNK